MLVVDPMCRWTSEQLWQELSSYVTNGGGHDAHATPSSVARVFSKRGFHGQERAVVNVMAQLRRSPTPPSVPASRSSRKFVQSTAIRKVAIGHQY